MLTLVTFNLLNDLSYWTERSPLIIQGLRDLQPELIAFQEVALPDNTAVQIADQLDGYSVHLCPYSNQRGAREGLAILSRLPVERYETLALGTQDRVAQRVIVQSSGHRWLLVNTHLFWSPFDDPVRMRQIEKIMHWIPPHLHTLICGDFNALPAYRAIKVMKRQFKSAYENLHDHEPEFTFPTPLKRGPGLRHSARRAALRTIGQITNQPWSSWQGTLDYIFISPSIPVIDCRVIMTEPSPDDPEIYASDHRGLFASFDLPPVE